MKKLLVFLLTLLFTISCSLQKDDPEPYNPPSIGAINEVKASGATSYPENKEQANELLQQNYAFPDIFPDLTGSSRKVVEKTEELSYSKDGTSIEGSFTIEKFVDDDLGEDPSKDYTPAAYIKMYGTPKVTFKDVNFNNGYNSLIINGNGAFDIGLYVEGNKYASTGKETMKIDYKMGMALNLAVLRDDGLGAKFSISFAQTLNETFDLKDSSKFQEEMEEIGENTLKNAIVTIKVYNDSNEEILNYTMPYSELSEVTLPI